MQNTSHAVMAQRHEALDSLDDFPTPPWATRALVEHVLRPRLLATEGHTVWEPACNRGLMAEPLKEYFGRVIASDIHFYGYRGGSLANGVMDFLSAPPGFVRADWVITNPPFRLALDFAMKALESADVGVALLVRSSWLEGGDRFRRLFAPKPPTVIAQFVERVPMVKGRWDPEASTATSYAWVVWSHERPNLEPIYSWIPPGCRRSLTKPDDVTRFAQPAAVPLLA